MTRCKRGFAVPLAQLFQMKVFNLKRVLDCASLEGLICFFDVSRTPHLASEAARTAPFLPGAAKAERFFPLLPFKHRAQQGGTVWRGRQDVKNMLKM